MWRRTLMGAAVMALLALVVPAFGGSAGAALIATAGRPQAPAIAYSPRSNSYLLVWAEDPGLGSGLDLYAARVTATGVVVGTAMPVVVSSGNQSDPTLAWSDKLDTFLVFYTTDEGPPVPTAGVPIPGTPATPPPFPTPPGPPPLSIARAVRPSTAGGAPYRLAARPAPAQPTFPPPVTAVPTATANPTGLPNPVDTPTATPPGTPPSPPGPAPGSRDIYGVWVAENGQRVSDTFPVIDSPADDTFPALAYRPAQQYDLWALAWRAVTGTTPSISIVELTGYGPYLTFSSAQNVVVSGADQGRPSVAIEDSGAGLVVWSETPTGQAARDIKARRLNLNMYPIGPVLDVVVDAEDEVYPSVASLGQAGGYLVTWEERASGQPPDIRLRRLNRNGIPLRQVYDVAGGPPFSFGPNLPSTDLSTRLLVWIDRNAASDQSILGVEVNRDGRRTGVERTLVQGGTGPAAVTPVYPPAPFPTLPPVPPGPPTP